jgi:hypothetical protein
MNEILTIDADAYHADPCDQPSLTASIASILCSRSPLHAWTAHPKLNPDFEPFEDAKFDIGTVAHAMLLQGDEVAVQVDAADWRTNAAKEERDAIRAVGRVPLLTKDWDRCVRMVKASRIQLAAIPSPWPFTAGLPEQSLMWEEPNGVICRSRLDWLSNDHRAVDDLKTTSRSANPEAWTRNTLYGIGGDVQAAMYLRGVKAVTGVDATFRWVIVETTPPHALAVVSPGPDVLALGNEKVEHAIRRWGECLESGVWPGYPAEVCHAELPSWEESRWLEHQEVAAA